MGNCFYKKTNLNQDFNELNIFTYSGKKVFAKVTDVYDGDTITIVFYDNEFKKFKLRLAGIDTPEIKPFLSVENRDIHVQSAKIVKKFVENMILNKIVYLRIEGEDKYGRLLGYIYINGICINNLLIDKKYALSYDGKTKNEFSYYFLQNIISIV